MEKKKSTQTSTSKKKESFSISLNSILIWLVLIGIVVYIIIDVTKLNKGDDVPVGTIIAFRPPDTERISPRWKRYSGKILSINKVSRWQNKTPDLRKTFIRGWTEDKSILGTADATTSAKNLSIEDHTHGMLSFTGPGGSGQPGGGDIFYASQATYSTATGVRHVAKPNDATKPAIESTPLTISGDEETAPQHIFIPFYIKCGSRASTN